MRLPIIAAVALALAPVQGGWRDVPSALAVQEAPPESASTSSALVDAAREALAADHCRRAIEASRLEPATSHAYRLAAELFRWADALDPDEPEILRGYLAAATLAEDAATRSALLERLSRLDPADERVRLARINDVLSRYGNAEELVNAYVVILQDDNIRKLGAPVASRLATSLAVLYERLGDHEAYASWISRASALDQSNKEAAALMVGYFQQHVADDPFGQAELLVNLLLADPIDVSTQTALARLFLEQGAYEGAARMHRLAVETHAAFRRYPAPDLIADLVLAEWGSSDTEEALRTIQSYQQILDEAIRMRALAENPRLHPEERAQLSALLPATLAAVQIAILDLIDPAAADEALAKVQEAFADALANQEADTTPQARQDLLLVQALLAAWFGHDGPAIAALVDQAHAATPIDDATRARFDAWIALRSGDLARAEELLTAPGAETDLIQQAALALLRMEQQRMEEAAELFSTIAARDPGSALGLWARDRASLITGAAAPVAPLALQLNELAASIPSGIDYVPADRRFGISLRIEPISQSFDLFGPVPVRLVITNHSGLPIGISPEGPLRPNAVVESDFSAPSQPRLLEGTPMVVDFGTRLRLAPREKLELVIDLRRHLVGDFIEACGAGGATVQLRGVLNPFSPNQSLIDAGPLGHVSRSGEFRVNGARINAEWIAATAALVREGRCESLRDLGLLIQAILTDGVTLGRTPGPDVAAALADATAALETSFDLLDPLVQAWMITVVPRRAEAMRPILEKARASSAAQVQLAYLMNQLEGLEDPALAAAEQSADGDLARIAAIVRTLIEVQTAAQEAAEEQQRQQRLPAPPGGTGGSGR